MPIEVTVNFCGFNLNFKELLMNKFKKNMSMRSISDYMASKEYPTKGETKAKHMECYDYFMSCKNSEMLKAYKEIHGLSGLEMRDMHHYYKHGRHDYDYDGDAKDNGFRKMVQKMNKFTDYDRRRSLQYVADLLGQIRTYRKQVKKRSRLDQDFIEKPDVIKKWATVSLRTCQQWWRDNHDRTSVSLGIQGMSDLAIDRYGSYNEKKSVINDKKDFTCVDNVYTVQNSGDKDSWNKRNGLLIPPLWYLQVYRHGLSSVVYKSRPCMVIRAKPMPIQRLKSQGIDVYKADIIKAHHGLIDVIKDLYLVSYQNKAYEKHPEGKQHIEDSDRTFAPQQFDTFGECFTACNENLRIAENTISGRLVSGITNSLAI